MMEISKTTSSDDGEKTGRTNFLKEVRCAVRFPLSLPVELPEDKQQDAPAVTRNVSANGVLLELSGPLDIGEELDFHLRMPGSVLGTPQDVLVHCRGRVVRCSISQSHYQAAATIDEYHFVEQ
jgi:PilZ domain